MLAGTTSKMLNRSDVIRHLCFDLNHRMTKFNILSLGVLLGVDLHMTFSSWGIFFLFLGFLRFLNMNGFSVQFSSVAQLCPTLCDPMNHSAPGLPVHHHLPEFNQTHVHRVGDAIQSSHPLSSPSPPAPIPPSIRVFSNESTLCMRWPQYWSFSLSISPSNEHPGLVLG